MLKIGRGRGIRVAYRKGALKWQGEQSGIIEMTVLFQREGGMIGQRRQVESVDGVEVRWRRD